MRKTHTMKSCHCLKITTIRILIQKMTILPSTIAMVMIDSSKC